MIILAVALVIPFVSLAVTVEKLTERSEKEWKN